VAIFLVAYGTGEGQTTKVAGRIEKTIEDRIHDVTAVDVESGTSWDEVKGYAADVGAFVKERLDSDVPRPPEGNLDR
jgi:menaquinone-dependent protoporphyrinogen oxidase